MEFRKILALRGPNIWANFPVLEVWLDLGHLKDCPSDELPGFNDRLMTWLPSLSEHRCSVGTRGGFFERLLRGTYQAHILEHVALELQSLAGTELGFGRTRETAEEGVYRVALEYEEEDLGRAALETARELCLAALHERPFDVPGEVARLRSLHQRIRPDASTAAVLAAARKRRIPAFRLADGLLLLGHGARQRRVRRGQTDRTSALAETVAGDHDLVRSLLVDVGVPVAHETAFARWHLLLVGERVVAALDQNSGTDVAERIHPAVREQAIDAARVIGLDVCGIDVVAGDIARPLEEQGGGVAAINPQPDPGLAWSLGEALVAEVFAPEQTGRIPIVAVTGVNGKTTTTRLIAYIISLARYCVGMTCTEGILVGGRRIETGDCSGPLSARTVLCHPAVEAAVLETARGGILRAGLGFDRCDVAVVTNIGEGDHLGVSGIDTLEQLARVKRTVVDVVAEHGTAVLKADDPLVAEMASACPGSVVFFARDGKHQVLAEHRQRGGRAVFVRDRRVVLSEGEQEIPLIALERVPLTHGGRVGFQVENVLAAAAAAWSLGVPCETIRTGLETFKSDLDRTPGRFNLLEVNGATVVLDYGHNPSSLACLLETLKQLPHSRRTAVYSAAGDRRDNDLIRQGELLGDAFDRVILYEEEHCIRGRQQGEIIALFRRGLDGKRTKDIEEVRGAIKAVEVALESARMGELLLVQVDRVDETIELVRGYLDSAKAREIDLDEALTGRPTRRKSRRPLTQPRAAVSADSPDVAALD